MKKKTFIPFLALILVLIISACAPQAGQEIPETGVTPGPGTPMTDEVGMQVQQFLSERLGVDVAQTDLVTVMNVDWPDSCLGLGGMDEICAAVITPGYLITANVTGQEYRVRASEDGSVIRLEGAADLGLDPAAPQIVLDNAMAFLNQNLGVPVDQIQVVSVTQVEWPDACLGLPEADEMCAQVITPGYSINVMVQDQVYEVRTDATGNVVRMSSGNQ
jgi:hypothetical protein